MNDKKAVQLSGRVTSLSATLQSVKNQFDNVLRGMNDELWTAWTGTDKVSELDFVLNESRNLAKDKMSPELESLALSLGVDGYHGWESSTIPSLRKSKSPMREDGKTVMLSAGQAFNKMHDPRREVRQSMFEKWEQAWGDSADYCADTLNHLSGYRLKLYENRGWEDVLKEPLAIGRMSRETLDTMWAVIQDTKSVLVEYLNRKAKPLGLEGLSWTDVDALRAHPQPKSHMTMRLLTLWSNSASSARDWLISRKWRSTRAGLRWRIVPASALAVSVPPSRQAARPESL